MGALVLALVATPAGLLVAIPTAASAASAGPAGSPDTYQQASTVTAVAVQSVNEQDPAPVTGIDKPFSAYTAYVSGDLDSTGVSDARAAVATPGTGLEEGLNELEGVAGCTACPPINNPLEVYATYPATPKAQTQSAPTTLGALTTTAGSATATAGEASNVAAATAAGSDLLAGSTAALTLGAMTSSLTQTITADGLVVQASSSVSHISLAGLVTIDGVTSVASQTLQDGRVVARTASDRIGGVTALGQPAAIDADGIHILSAGDSGVLLSTLNKTLASALSALHLSVTAGDVDRSAAGSGGNAEATGLTISYDETIPAAIVNAVPVLPALPSQVPLAPPSLPSEYTGTVVIGSAGTVTGSVAVPAFEITLPGAPLPPVTTPGGGSAGIPSRTVFVPGTPGTPGISGGGPGVSTAVITRGFGQTLENWSLRAPYLVLVVMAIMTLVGICRGAFRRTHAEEDM
jgi:hypothetical protein